MAQNCRDIESKLDRLRRRRGRRRSSGAAVETHLQRCPPCRSAVATERAGHELICRAGAATSAAARPRRCASAARRSARSPPDAQASARSAPWCRCRSPPSLVLGRGALLMFGWGSSVETYAAQLAADHVKCFQFPPRRSRSPRRGPGRSVAGGERLAAQGRRPLRVRALAAARRPPVRLVARTGRAYPL